MKVLFITRGYPSESYRTLGIFEYDMAKALVQRGHEVVYVAVDMRSLRRKRKWGFESFIRDGIQIEGINFPLGRIYNPLKTVISQWLLIHRFKVLEKRYGSFDVIHAHFIGSAYLGAKLKEKTGIPLVITEHSSKLNTGVSPYIQRKLAYAYEKADQLTTVSRALSDVIEDHFGEKSIVIPNIVDTDVFTLKTEERKMEGFRFASTGNLISGKGMNLTIEAFSEVVRKYPESELWIFGQGPQRESLMNQVQTLGLEDKIQLKGLVSREELNAAYDDCDFFVLASYSETFGVAYIEALAKGIPVIGTDCGGPNEFIHEKNGIITVKGDVQALYEAMIHLIEHKSLYSSEVISEEIKDKYSPAMNAIALERIYNRVADKTVNDIKNKSDETIGE